MDRIAILYIAIGKYDIFWNDFYNSCELNFLRDVPKTYFIFTDSRKIDSKQDVHIIPVKDYGWPRNTLDRFSFFDKVSNELTNFDFCFFFNANTKFIKKVEANEIIPNEEQDYLVNLSWNTDDGKKPSDLPYERDQNSMACMNLNGGSKYYRGGIIGARTKEFLEMKDVLIKNISEDDKHQIIAIHHDESHLNKYLADKKPLCLSTYYGRPEEWVVPEDPAIIFRKKENVVSFFYFFKYKRKPAVYLLRNLYSRIKKCLRYRCW